MAHCGCSLKIRCLLAGTASLVFSLFVLFVALKELIFETNFLEERIQTDVVVVSIVAVIFTIVLLVGIIKESRHLFLPWLFASAIAISMFFLYSVYLIVFCFHTDLFLGCILFIIAVLCYSGWVSVAAFYSKLKDKEVDDSTSERCSSVGVEIFTRPTPPPPYTISYENPLAYEKPPAYDEAIPETDRY